MAVQYSIQKMVSDGTLSTIALGIQYLQRNDIYIRIAGEETPQSGAPSGYTWSFINNTTLKILPVVPNGVEVVVYRRTDVDAMYNVYSQNAQFDEATIDENNQQLLYIAQEYLEQGIPGAGVASFEYVDTVNGINYYRFKLTDGSYTPTFGVPDGTDVLRTELLNGPLLLGEDGRFVLAHIVYARDFVRQTDTNPIQFIQRAMDYCAVNNKDLCISEAYEINAPLIYKGNGFFFPAIYGVGGNSGLIKTTNTKTGATSNDAFGINWDVDAVIVIPAITNQPKTVVIERITISGTDTVTPDYGVFTTKCENLEINKCLVTKVGIGVLDSGSWVSSVERTVFRRVAVGGYKKLTGTSTHLSRCYVDISGGFGFWLKSGYSGIHNCACDKTSTYSYIVEGEPSETTSDMTYLISNCGSENSGSGAPIKVIGAAFTTIDTFTAFNWDQQQTPEPAAFLEIEASFTQVHVINARYIGVGKFLNEIGQQNVIYISGRTSRDSAIPFGSYHVNTKIIEMSRDGIKFSRGVDTTGIALTNEDITDGNTNTNWCGLRNKKVIVRGSVTVARTVGQSYGQATFTLPLTLNDYRASATLVAGDITATTTHIPVISVIKGVSSMTVVVNSANNSQTWSNFSVELVIVGVRP